LVAETVNRGAYRPAEAAKWLGCSRDTIDRLCERGVLRSFKVGAARYISVVELERFVREREREAGFAPPPPATPAWPPS
jgi:excisionase family DNA binding protein